ncbi:GDSL-type esterase/lipase family protein [Asticcacaulis sp.]|uniref:SGNH/GDSL hydrolase family protein n=1 Tax=Asticcacaulis sp. TaxID=1872648 RepID=UPI0039E2EF1E
MAISTAHAQTPSGPAASVIVKSLGVPCPDCKMGERVPLHIGGRFYQYMHQWPGAYWEANIKGTSFKLILSDTANIFSIYVDGHKIDSQRKPLYQAIQYSGLSDGSHRVRVETLTESQDAEYTGVGDIEVDDPANVLPAPQPRSRQIEFIGDSYTAGYGNTSPKRECTKDEIWATTDTQQAFGPLTAKHYDADYQINAYSGIGIVRNYDGVAPKRNMPLLYRSALIEDETLHPYDNAGWDPAIVVIALGGNDFSTPVHAGEKWASEDALTADYIASYVAFVQQVRASHPGARFILMDYGETRVAAAISEVIKRLNAAGETRVASLDVGSGFAQTGCDWHLNTADDQRISASLIAYIDAHPELWANPGK